MPNQKLVIRFEPRIDAVPALLDRLETYAEATELSPRTTHRLVMVCEELAVNVALHGTEGPGGASYIELSVDRAGALLRVSIEDDGRPFDPLARAAPVTDLGLEHREVGGLGIHFVRSLVQNIAYERVDTRNRLTAVLDAAL